MKVTDYSKIANKYEKNQYRLDEVQFDNDLKEYIDNNPKTMYQVLDLACGTGIYLDNQKKYFDNFDIDWHGLDASEDMLKKAKEKLEDVSLVHGLVEDMPYEDEKFDYISNNYAFHHFINKEAALDEVYRVLKKNGVYKLHNITIHDMKKWWVYHYFPTAYYEDLKRFWEKEVIFNELSIRGFKVNMQIEYRLEKVRVSDYLGYAENRDISILTLIDDQDYQEGLEKMRYDVKNNPDKTIVNDFAEMFCFSRKM
ncbi:ubiquinone/menaquinone biosynthesis C-methylase UbiE [Bacillus pakistanensis]|uniref:Ubiquinone/menaquinone biosynthesis C-methylase UbiE n=1 Tax=Rossellomorea pakistanensis TaxID=992288 RepID=A0ABS2N7S9_9BACI|nr:class I SAM-dependent methyltransferase [Bacillus pakistanensis]MBM7583915.1 ubiquinone/menaquinone biosynthesis C-methylase UbiE [Bacillus pakistanensis]